MKKKGWERKTLGSLCNIQLGKTPFRKNAKFWDIEKNSGNVWLSIRDLKHGEFVTESSEQITDLAAKNIIKIPKGTIMVSFKLTLGRVSFAGKDLYTNEAIASLLNLSNEINIEYLFYYFSFFDWNKATDGDIKLKGRTLNKQKLQELDIILPPLKEQEEIVSKLDKGFELIDRLKENAEKNLENAKELFQSALREELSPKKGWETKKLKEIGNATTGQTPPTKDKDNFGDFIPFVKPADFLNGKLDYNNDGLSEKGMKYSRISEKGATLMVCIGATIGKTAFTEQNVTSNQQINSIYPNKDFFPKYIYYLLISKDFYNQVLKNASQATLPIINKSKWENLSVSFPSNIKQQEEIVTKLDKIKAMCEELEENYKKSVLLCEELKQGLLREVFED